MVRGVGTTPCRAAQPAQNTRLTDLDPSNVIKVIYLRFSALKKIHQQSLMDWKLPFETMNYLILTGKKIRPAIHALPV